MAPLNLAAGPSSIKVKVQPAVLLSICDAYVRRNSKHKRVVGTLLGYVGEGGVVEVKNCYAVPHNDHPDSVEVDIPQHTTMKELHHKVNPKENVIGWFTTSTGESLHGRDILIQDWYGSECQNPILLAVDTTLQDDKLDVKAFVSRQLVLKDKPVATEFRPVDCEVRTAELGKLGRGVLGSGQDKPTADVDQLSLSFSQLQAALEQAHAYVESVVSGDRKADPGLGRLLADTVRSVPCIPPDELEQLVADDAQDALLIMYLANLVRTQLALADRLGTSALPLL